MTAIPHPYRAAILAECFKRSTQNNMNEVDPIVDIVEQYLPQSETCLETWSKKYYACVAFNGYNSIHIYDHTMSLVRTHYESGTIKGILISPDEQFVSAVCNEKLFDEQVLYIRSFDIHNDYRVTYPSTGWLGRLCIDMSHQTVEKLYYNNSSGLRIIVKSNRTGIDLSFYLSEVLTDATDALQIKRDGEFYTIGKMFLTIFSWD